MPPSTDTRRRDGPPATQPPTPSVRPLPGEVLWYAGAVIVGAVLIVITAITQPYNQNEWAQIAPYSSSDLHQIVSGTRQPPLDPLIGALIQHLFGEGQLRQRLEPVLCGIGSLALVAALLRRMRLGVIGVLTAFVLATAPVFVRYSAYIRPYALPTLLMLVICYAGSRWLEGGRRGWLALSAVMAVLLPLTRVPEPTVFLSTSAWVMAWLGWRGTFERRRAWSLGATLLAALVTVGLISLLTLASQTGRVFDTDPVHAVHRAPAGARELAGYVGPLLGHWFPWWPVTVAFLVLGITLPVARRELRDLWFWLPIALAPVVFLVAYHTLNAYPLHLRHYRARFAYFFAPGFVFLVAAVGIGLRRWGTDRRVGEHVGALAITVLLVSQLPTTWSVMTENDVPDLGRAGAVLRAEVPRDAVVLYDSPAPTGYWRQPFFGQPRYLVGAPHVTTVSNLSTGKAAITATGPVYLLVLDSRCASSVVCDMPGVRWSGVVPGYREAERFDRFTLYAPTEGQRGRSGAAEALAQLATAYGVVGSETDVFARARLLRRLGELRAAIGVIDEHCDTLAHPGDRPSCRQRAADLGLRPGP